MRPILQLSEEGSDSNDLAPGQFLRGDDVEHICKDVEFCMIISKGGRASVAYLSFSGSSELLSEPEEYR